jgi:glutaredoxin
MIEVTLYSRPGCHLCENALSQLQLIREEIAHEITFEINEISITDDPALLNKFSDYIPVIHINGQPHDFFKVDRVRFIKALSELN